MNCREVMMAAKPESLRTSCIAGIFLLIIICMGIVFIPDSAPASAPVEKTLTGCVVGGRFYSIYSDHKTARPTKAYVIGMEGTRDIAPFEGKKVSIMGFLLPGDRFHVKEGHGFVVVGQSCPDTYQEVIRKEFIVQYRLAAGEKARKGDYDEALRISTWAIDMDKTLCDSYLDRARILYLKGDYFSGADDINVVRKGFCMTQQGLNFLTIEEIGIMLERENRKAEAVELYKIGLDACQSDICRETMDKDMKKVKGQ